MKQLTYIIVPGLGDHKPIFGWFYQAVGKRWNRSGMRTIVFEPRWISDEPYEAKMTRLLQLVGQQQEGRGVVLIGISAGATLGLLGISQAPQAVVALVSVCGFVRLQETDRDNEQLMALSWYKAADAAERAVSVMTHQRARILCLVPRTDTVIKPEQQGIEGASYHRIASGGHLLSIVMVLYGYRQRIEQFANGRT